ncbi:hypothetical protein SAMN02745220_04270 [Desulfopila aestuarii DSM 18488]|uniref:Uncharacterized protein n=1 Tax=Desulfopila aestuarii DSM 18488 TaxID=1121416 RepID=A0A1M7YH95_9BACT|nr:hypothetical protein SAMN02745220_04270 [Desulfopila aestuarii DSM 18488]
MWQKFLTDARVPGVIAASGVEFLTVINCPGKFMIDPSHDETAVPTRMLPNGLPVLVDTTKLLSMV